MQTVEYHWFMSGFSNDNNNQPLVQTADECYFQMKPRAPQMWIKSHVPATIRETGKKNSSTQILTPSTFSTNRALNGALVVYVQGK